MSLWRIWLGKKCTYLTLWVAKPNIEFPATYIFSSLQRKAYFCHMGHSGWPNGNEFLNYLITTASWHLLLMLWIINNKSETITPQKQVRHAQEGKKKGYKNLCVPSKDDTVAQQETEKWKYWGNSSMAHALCWIYANMHRMKQSLSWGVGHGFILS